MIVFSSVPSKKIGKLIAKSLLNDSLAACIKITKKVTSFYAWQGEICVDKERILLIKSTPENFKNIEKVIKKLHPYENPEIFSINFSDASKEYLYWIENFTKK